jgi:hypothetical protein
VNDDVTGVDQNPVSGLLAFAVNALPPGFLQIARHLVGDAADMPARSIVTLSSAFMSSRLASTMRSVSSAAREAALGSGDTASEDLRLLGDLARDSGDLDRGTDPLGC